MASIGEWRDACAQDDEAAFVAAHPRGFLLYSREHGSLVRVDVSAGATLNRAVLADSDGAAPLTRDTLFEVYDLDERVEPDGGVLAGAGPECGVVINDDSISANHARFELTDAGMMIVDADSTLGTQVEGATLTAGEPRLLAANHKITLGSVPLTYLPAQRFRHFVRQILQV